MKATDVCWWVAALALACGESSGGVDAPGGANGGAGSSGAGGRAGAAAGGGRGGASGAGGRGGGAGASGNGGTAGNHCGCTRGAQYPVCGVDLKNYDASCGLDCVPVAIYCEHVCPCEGSGGSGGIPAGGSSGVAGAADAGGRGGVAGGGAESAAGGAPECEEPTPPDDDPGCPSGDLLALPSTCDEDGMRCYEVAAASQPSPRNPCGLTEITALCCGGRWVSGQTPFEGGTWTPVSCP